MNKLQNCIKNLRPTYDFSNAERGKFHRSAARLNLRIYLDEDIFIYLANKAKSKNVEVNEIVYDLLRKDIELIEGVK